MWYVKPENSRNKVNKAGKILVSPSSYSTEEVVHAHDVLSNWRAAHAYPVNTFQATLRYRLKKMRLSALVAQRLKRTPSIVGKLCREGNMNLARMQDIGGLRAVVGTIPNVRAIEEYYRNKQLTHKLIDSDDYIDSPKEDGYRSVHLVYKYQNVRALEFDNLRLELQIRTRHQHAWATAVETMSTYLGTALKSGEGDEKWRNFFRVASNAMAHTEDAPCVPGFEGLDRVDSLLYLRDVESDVGVLEQLRGYSVATDQITHGGKGDYHLVILDARHKNVTIRSYPAEKLELAAEDYYSVENLPSYGDGIEAVLVSTASIKSLKTAYPNYFLDTHEFVWQVEKLLKEAGRSNRSNGAKLIVGENKRVSNRSLRANINTPKIIGKILSSDVPQAENLDSIRIVLESIRNGCISNSEISDKVNMSPRHVNYRLTAARVLGCLDSSLILTTAGETWLRRGRGTVEELEYLRSLIEGTQVYQLVVPDLFDFPRLSRASIAKRIQKATGLSASTSDRRAATLISWSDKLRQGCLIVR